MTTAAQKDTERRHVDQLLSLGGIDAVVEKQSDRPDFILRFRDRRIGLEHAELQDPLLSKAAAVKRSFEVSVAGELRARAVGSDIGVCVRAAEGARLFAQLGRKRAGVLASRIADLALSIATALPPDTTADVGRDEVQALAIAGLEAIAVQRFALFTHGPRCDVQTGYWGAGAAEVREAIDAKEKLLPDYRANAAVDDLWLLLVTGDTITQTVDMLLLDETSFSSRFERVYLLDLRAGKARRIDDRGFSGTGP